MFSVHIIIIYRYVFRKYYTNWHDVDEELMTILIHGGAWYQETQSGISRRHMSISPTTSGIDVASKKNNAQPPSKIGGCAMYYITISPCQSFYGFQWLNIKTILGLYIAYYTYAPLLTEGEM